MNTNIEKRQFLFRKAVNKDALYQYIGISLNFSHFIYDEFGYIDIGKGKNIKVWIEDEVFSAKLLHSNIRRMFLSIKYSSYDASLPTKLREIFKSTTAFFDKCDEYKRRNWIVPNLKESDKEYIDVDLVQGGFIFTCYPKGADIPDLKTKTELIDASKSIEQDEQNKQNKTPVVSSVNKISFLIAKGKHRGFVKESEILSILPEETSVEKIEEIFNIIVANNIELRWEE